MYIHASPLHGMLAIQKPSIVASFAHAVSVSRGVESRKQILLKSGDEREKPCATRRVQKTSRQLLEPFLSVRSESSVGSEENQKRRRISKLSETPHSRVHRIPSRA